MSPRWLGDWRSGHGSVAPAQGEASALGTATDFHGFSQHGLKAMVVVNFDRGD